MMNRRELLKKTAMTALGVGALPGLTTLLESCGVSRERLSDYQPTHLSAEQFDTVWLLSETILPSTDTPGAAEAGVAPFIDLLFASFYTDEERIQQTAALNDFLSNTKESMNKHFLDLDEEERTAYLTGLEDREDRYFRSFKRLTLWAFFSSEPGRKSLNYLPIPGRYEGTIIDENEKLLIGN